MMSRKTSTVKFRKGMYFILGSHAAGKTTFLTTMRDRFACNVVLGDSDFTPTEEEKHDIIDGWYNSPVGYIIEGQRFFRQAAYEAILRNVTAHPDVLTHVLFTFITPDEMLKRVRERKQKEPSNYLKEKAEYESYTRFARKISTLFLPVARVKANFKVHEICVDDFSNWSTVLTHIQYYPRF